jgi:hypothetical protein
MVVRTTWMAPVAGRHFGGMGRSGHVVGRGGGITALDADRCQREEGLLTVAGVAPVRTFAV